MTHLVPAFLNPLPELISESLMKCRQGLCFIGPQLPITALIATCRTNVRSEIHQCMKMSALVFVIASLYVACRSVAGVPNDSTCVHLRLVDKNLEKVEQAALRAAGLGEGAGQYLSHADVADLSGRWDTP